MCGIAGLLIPQSGVASAADAASAVRAMTTALVHRGPDAEGIWADPHGRCVLGNRRLSVIDVSEAGRQPMASFDARWIITFNGEIYNFHELRLLIEGTGLRFRSRADTEVLINAIALWQTAALERLDGMFAFAAFDTASGELLLARDPFGEKPLYYSELPDGGLVFASELQALEQFPQLDREVDLEATAELLMFQYIGAPRSIYRSVKKLPPGHWLLAAPGQPLRIERYFKFQPGANGFDARPLAELADELEDKLIRGIRRRVVADVPLGAFLSGGVDSATVCALVRHELGLPLRTFSIGFADAPESEDEPARLFARHLGLDHSERILRPDVMEALAGIGRWQDEPNADWSCLPVYLLSQLAREHVTVAVSGDGGDEMFAGYKRYFKALDRERAASDPTTLARRAGESYYDGGLLVMGETAIAELFGAVPPGLAAHLGRLRDEIDRASPPLLCRLRSSDVENYLPGAVLAKVDRMSMQHSLEVRSPFLSVELARFAERLPASVLYGSGQGKLVLREVAYRHLPRGLVDGPKLGFGLPNPGWAREEIRRVALRLLGSHDSRLRNFFGGNALDALMREQPAPRCWWALATLESWCRHHDAKLPEFVERRA